MRLLGAATTVALAATSLITMLDRIFGMLLPIHSSVRRMGASRPQVLREASRGRPFRYLGSLNMGEGLVEPGTTNNVSVMDTSRPRPLLRKCINDAPREPGVYIMESVEGRKLYIGKSINLRSRVPTYFGSSSGGDGSGGDLPAAEDTAAVVLPGRKLSRRIAVMTTLVERIDYIVTSSGASALLLEASLIRQHQPPFNVLLKDDKQNYPYVCFTWSEPYPRLIITRDKPRRGGGAEDRYYGPFVDSGQVKSTVALVRRVLPLRERSRPLYSDKPCLNYDIGICPGACQGLVSESDYAETVRLAEMVFAGDGGGLLATLEERMQNASRAEEFERAGEIKAHMALVRGGLLGSALHFSSTGVAAGRNWADDGAGVESGGCVLKRDVVAVGLAGDLACFQVFRIRDGRLTGRLGFTYRVGEGLTRGEILQACLERYWRDALESAARPPSVSGSHSDGTGRLDSSCTPSQGEYFVDVPDEIVTADELPEGGSTLLSELLSGAREASKAKKKHGRASGSKRETCSSTVTVVHGEGKGEKHHLCVLVSKNAELEAKRLRKGSEATLEGLSQLANMLGLASPPARIEGYDVSHTGGGQAVASVVLFVGGKANTKGHRRYKIKSSEVRKGHSDDYASLKEVIARRFAPPRPPPNTSFPTAVGGAATGDTTGPLPDLVLIDGGNGQLAAALEGAAIAADSWRSLDCNGRVTSDEARHHVNQVARGTGAGASVEGVSGLVIDDGARSAASSPSSSLSPSAPESGGTSFVDPDDVLLSATPSSDPLNGMSGVGSRVDVGGGRSVVFASLAKKEEEVFVPWVRGPLEAAVRAGPNSPGMLILRQVRDEAHRFALAYHRTLRGKDMFHQEADSEVPTGGAGIVGSQGGFEDIAGLSSKTRQALVKAFGSLEGARLAGQAELRRIPGIGPTLSRRIIGQLNCSAAPSGPF